MKFGFIAKHQEFGRGLVVERSVSRGEASMAGLADRAVGAAVATKS